MIIKGYICYQIVALAECKVMDTVQASVSVSISELKRNPTAIIEAAGAQPIAVLNHNRPTGYLVPASTFAALIANQKTYQNRLLADFLTDLPKATSYGDTDPLTIQQALRDEW